MLACRRQLHRDLVGAPLAPVAAPDESRRSRLLVKNERPLVFVQGRRSCRSAFSPPGARRCPIRRRPVVRHPSRQTECTSDDKTRLLHRFRSAFNARRGRTGNFTQASSRRSQSALTIAALCIIASTVLHGEHTSREGQTRPPPGYPNGAGYGRNQTIRPVSDGAYCASFRPALSLSWIRSRGFARHFVAHRRRTATAATRDVF
jgi:hypothetical protein